MGSQRAGKAFLPSPHPATLRQGQTASLGDPRSVGSRPGLRQSGAQNVQASGPQTGKTDPCVPGRVQKSCEGSGLSGGAAFRKGAEEL